MNSMKKIYDTAVTRRVSISSALAADQAQREPLHVRAKRDEATGLMRHMLDVAESAGRAFTALENSDWSALEQQVDLFASEIDLENRRLDKNAQRHFGANASGRVPVHPTGWTDADSGHPVAVFQPGEPMSRERVQGSVGGLIRAMVTGRRGTDAEIMALARASGAPADFWFRKNFPTR